MYEQVVESCDCVDEETECDDGRVQGEERIQQVLSVLSVIRVNSLQSASSQILAKVVKRCALSRVCRISSSSQFPGQLA